MSTLTIAKFITSTGTDVTSKTSVKKMRTVTICSTFIPDGRYDKSIFKHTGNLYDPNTRCSGTPCVHKKTFHSIARSEYQFPQ